MLGRCRDLLYGGSVLVAAVQTATTLDVEENRRLVEKLIGEAADAGATLVLFPEATMCTFGDASVDLAAVAEPLDGPFVDVLSGCARRHDVTVVAGMFERADTRADAGRVHNTTVAVGPAGLTAAYRKVHLFDALGARESARVAPGDPAEAPVVFGVDGLRAGILTCYDLRFPESARTLVDQGAELLLVPAHWYGGPGKAEVWEVLVAARAIESTAYVVAAGKPAPECVGTSMVVDPAGRVLTRLGRRGEGTATAEVSAARVAEVRSTLPVLEHRRFGVHPLLATPNPAV